MTVRDRSRWAHESVPKFYIDNGPALDGALELHQDREQMWSEGPRADPRWEFTDSHGHYHAYSSDKDEPYPTLESRVEHVECDGSCGGVCEGVGYHRVHYHCRACGEEVVPGSIPGPHSIDIPGMKSWTVVVHAHVHLRAQVSVRMEDGQEVRFGVAQATDVHRDFDGSTTTTLVGIGPLGRRKA